MRILARRVSLIGLLAAATPFLANAQATLPFTFAPNTPAKAAEVNANFQALANQLPRNVIAVSADPSNPIASGTALLNALASITNAAGNVHYVVRLGPGVYDLGTGTLQMKFNVDVEGSGTQQTVITSTNSDPTQGTVLGPPAGFCASELRNVTVQNTSISSGTGVVATSALCLTNMTINLNGSAGTAYGLRATASTAYLNQVSITVTPAPAGSGVGILAASSATLDARNLVILVNGGNSAVGMQMQGSSGGFMTNVEISAIGAPAATGLQFTTGAGIIGRNFFVRGETNAASGTATAVLANGNNATNLYGGYFYGAGPTGSTRYGVSTSGGGIASLSNVVIEGLTVGVNSTGTGSNVLLFSSYVNGGIAASSGGTVFCRGITADGPVVAGCTNNP